MNTYYLNVLFFAHCILKPTSQILFLKLANIFINITDFT